ncbi:piggyBac transposable element-derived protein 3 [Trichonephila clavipes]|nr:piggyBac transposable element-derived protein 3 [Trichonephila clavipes]
MIPYYGHHSANMLIKSKLIIFGYKIWILCSSSGYSYSMRIYCGRKPPETKNSPLGSRVVWELLSTVQSSDIMKYSSKFVFSSHKLLTELSEKSFKTTGTIRDNRTGRRNFKSPKEAKNLQRGNFD